MWQWCWHFRTEGKDGYKITNTIIARFGERERERERAEIW